MAEIALIVIVALWGASILRRRIFGNPKVIQLPIKRDWNGLLDREQKLRDFKSWQECPGCGSFDNHWIYRIHRKTLTRQCCNEKCLLKWKQYK